MDLEVLRKKISTFRGEGGKLRNVSDELLFEILTAWEHWTGPLKGFYSAIEVDSRKMASLLGRAKKLKREGHFPSEEFKEIKLNSENSFSSHSEEGQGLSLNEGSCFIRSGIEVHWENGKLIRFSQVDQLVDFLKKVA